MKIKNRILAYSAVAAVLVVTILLEMLWVKEWKTSTSILTVLLLAAELAAGLLVIYAGKDFDTGSIAIAHYGLRLCAGIALACLVLILLPSLAVNKWVLSVLLLALLYFAIKFIILIIAANH